MAKTIIIPSWKQGGTLSQIAQKYGTDVDTLMKLNPSITDKNKIQQGGTLTLPDMAGTLNETTSSPTGGVAPILPTGDRTLPEGTGDNLTNFRSLMKKISEKTAANAAGNINTAIGANPSQISGGTLGDVTNFINKYAVGGVQSDYKATVDMLKETMKNSQDSIQMLISSGGIAELDDKTLLKLANNAEVDYDVLLGIREAKKKEKDGPSSFSMVDKSDGQHRIGFDKSGNIVSDTLIAGTEGSVKGFGTPSNADRVNAKTWLMNQKDFDEQDLKRMETDEKFFFWVLNQAKVSGGLE